MRAISLWQPWATWTEKEWKKIETRRHSRLRGLVGQRIIIQAAEKWDPEWWYKSEKYLTEEQYQETAKAAAAHLNKADIWPRKALICTVFPYGHGPLGDMASNAALCNCYSTNNLFGLFLQDVRRFTPIPWPGKQFPFEVPDEVIKEAKHGSD